MTHTYASYMHCQNIKAMLAIKPSRDESFKAYIEANMPAGHDLQTYIAMLDKEPQTYIADIIALEHEMSAAVERLTRADALVESGLDASDNRLVNPNGELPISEILSAFRREKDNPCVFYISPVITTAMDLSVIEEDEYAGELSYAQSEIKPVSLNERLIPTGKMEQAQQGNLGDCFAVAGMNGFTLTDDGSRAIAGTMRDLTGLSEILGFESGYLDGKVLVRIFDQSTEKVRRPVYLIMPKAKFVEHGVNSSDLWANVFTQAVIASSENQEAGHLVKLTGTFFEDFLADDRVTVAYKKGEIAQAILSDHASGQLVVGQFGTKQPNVNPSKRETLNQSGFDGIYMPHAYTVIGMEELVLEDGSVHPGVRLSNPHGRNGAAFYKDGDSWRSRKIDDQEFVMPLACADMLGGSYLSYKVTRDCAYDNSESAKKFLSEQKMENDTLHKIVAARGKRLSGSVSLEQSVISALIDELWTVSGAGEPSERHTEIVNKIKKELNKITDPEHYQACREYINAKHRQLLREVESYYQGEALGDRLREIHVRGFNSDIANLLDFINVRTGLIRHETRVRVGLNRHRDGLQGWRDQFISGPLGALLQETLDVLKTTPAVPEFETFKADLTAHEKAFLENDGAFAGRLGNIYKKRDPQAILDEFKKGLRVLETKADDAQNDLKKAVLRKAIVHVEQFVKQASQLEQCFSAMVKSGEFYDWIQSNRIDLNNVDKVYEVYQQLETLINALGDVLENTVLEEKVQGNLAAQVEILKTARDELENLQPFTFDQVISDQSKVAAYLDRYDAWNKEPGKESALKAKMREKLTSSLVSIAMHSHDPDLQKKILTKVQLDVNKAKATDLAIAHHMLMDTIQSICPNIFSRKSSRLTIHGHGNGKILHDIIKSLKEAAREYGVNIEQEIQALEEPLATLLTSSANYLTGLDLAMHTYDCNRYLNDIQDKIDKGKDKKLLRKTETQKEMKVIVDRVAALKFERNSKEDAIKEDILRELAKGILQQEEHGLHAMLSITDAKLDALLFEMRKSETPGLSEAIRKLGVNQKSAEKQREKNYENIVWLKGHIAKEKQERGIVVKISKKT